MVKALVCDPVSDLALRILEEAGVEVSYRPDIGREELLSVVDGYEVLVVRSRTRVDAEVITRGGRLRVVGRAGTGLDNIDLEKSEERGVAVVNTPEAPVNAVAELVIGLMIAVSRGIHVGDRLIRLGKWPKKHLVGTELHGKTLGVVGLGRIGRRVAEIARGFGMKILAYDVVEIPKEVLDALETKLIPLDELLRNSDYITLHVPLTEETRHMINEEKLKIMKRSAFLINASRGAVIDEEALYKALKEGWIAGAALDVFEHEPPAGSRLLELDNIVVTPHIGAQTKEAQELAATLLAERIVAKLREMQLLP
ncbi:MAG TPA: 3-phosphoglycerate dehydrogenase [Aigarchaeota archaeon]|nr:3-phosphoglycerate dehydrogenase [Aigarchaeota archaeon]